MENTIINGPIQVEQPTPEKQNKRVSKKLIILVSAVLLLIVLIIISVWFYYRDGSTNVGDSFSASQDEQLDPRFAEADDTVFDYGAFPKDNIVDTTTYDIPTAPEELSKEFERVVNTSPAYSGIDSIYEVLSWDDFDKDGDIKEETMRAIIAGADAGGQL
jgi:hypothetical protein